MTLFKKIGWVLLRHGDVQTVNEVFRQRREHLELIAWQQAEIVRLKAEYSRWGRDMLEQFLIWLDAPEHEDELRERLAAAVKDMNDECARLEEFVG